MKINNKIMIDIVKSEGMSWDKTVEKRLSPAVVGSTVA